MRVNGKKENYRGARLRKKPRLFALLSTAVLSAALVCGTALAFGAKSEAPSLPADAAGNDNLFLDGADIDTALVGAQASTVYMGSYTGNISGYTSTKFDIPWLVLSNSGGELLLMSRYLIGYSTGVVTGTNAGAGRQYAFWANSRSRIQLNGGTAKNTQTNGTAYNGGMYKNYFSAEERSAIKLTKVTTQKYYGNPTGQPYGDGSTNNCYYTAASTLNNLFNGYNTAANYIYQYINGKTPTGASNTALAYSNGVETTYDYLYLPDMYTMVNTSYGFAGTIGSASVAPNTTRLTALAPGLADNGTGSQWWLRQYGTSTANSDGIFIIRMNGDGRMDPGCGSWPNKGLRPMMNLDKSQIQMVSAKGAKTLTEGEFKSGLGSITAVTTEGKKQTKEYKLTLHDSALDGMTVSNPVVGGGCLTFDYSGVPSAGQSGSITVQIKRNNKIAHYGLAKKTAGASGSATVALPADFNPLTDTIYVANENMTGRETADTSSAPVELSEKFHYTVPAAISSVYNGESQGVYNLLNGKVLAFANMTFSGDTLKTDKGEYTSEVVLTDGSDWIIDGVEVSGSTPQEVKWSITPKPLTVNIAVDPETGNKTKLEFTDPTQIYARDGTPNLQIHYTTAGSNSNVNAEGYDEVDIPPTEWGDYCATAIIENAEASNYILTGSVSVYYSKPKIKVTMPSILANMATYDGTEKQFEVNAYDPDKVSIAVPPELTFGQGEDGKWYVKGTQAGNYTLKVSLKDGGSNTQWADNSGSGVRDLSVTIGKIRLGFTADKTVVPDPGNKWEWQMGATGFVTVLSSSDVLPTDSVVLSAYYTTADNTAVRQDLAYDIESVAGDPFVKISIDVSQITNQGSYILNVELDEAGDGNSNANYEIENGKFSLHFSVTARIASFTGVVWQMAHNAQTYTLDGFGDGTLPDDIPDGIKIEDGILVVPYDDGQPYRFSVQTNGLADSGVKLNIDCADAGFVNGYSGTSQASDYRADAYTVTVSIACLEGFALKDAGGNEVTEMKFTFRYKIDRAKFNISDVKWNYDAATSIYNDGTPIEIVLINLPKGLTAKYSGNKQTEAGDYTADVVFSCGSNYVKPTDAEIAHLKNFAWTIKPKGITVEWEFPSDGDTTSSVYWMPRLKNYGDKVEYRYFADNGGSIGAEIPVSEVKYVNGEERTYWIKAELKSTIGGVETGYDKNYYLDDPNSDNPQMFTVGASKTPITVTISRNGAEYDGTPHGTMDDVTVIGAVSKSDISLKYYSYDGGVKTELSGVASGEGVVHAGTYIIEIVLEGSINDEYYVRGTQEITYVVAKAKIDLSGFRWQFDGKYIYFYEDDGAGNVTEKWLGLDEEGNEIEIDPLSHSGPFAYNADERYIRFADVREEDEKNASRFEYEFDDDLHALVVYEKGKDGAERTRVAVITLTGGHYGTETQSYTAAFTCAYDDADNYEIANVQKETLDWGIVKAELDMSGVHWNADTFQFELDAEGNAVAHKVFLEGLPEYLQTEGMIVYGAGNTGSAVGSYTATYSFSSDKFDDKNYIRPEMPVGLSESLPWKIETREIVKPKHDVNDRMVYKDAPYDLLALSGVTGSDWSNYFTVGVKYVEPDSVTGVGTEVEGEERTQAVNAGKYIITYTFKSEVGKNVRWDDHRSTPAVVTVWVDRLKIVLEDWADYEPPEPVVAGQVDSKYYDTKITNVDGTPAPDILEYLTSYYAEIYLTEPYASNGNVELEAAEGKSLRIAFTTEADPSLDPPTPIAQPVIKTSKLEYNGKPQTFEIEGLDERYLVLEGDLTQTLPGKYSVTVNFVAGANAQWDTEEGGKTPLVIEFEIAKRGIARPTVDLEKIEYTGEEIVYEPDGFDAEWMEISDNAATDAGEYVLTVSLKFAEYTYWLDGGSEDETAPVSFVKPLADETEEEGGEDIPLNTAPLQLQWKINKAKLNADWNTSGKTPALTLPASQAQMIEYVYFDANGNEVSADNLEGGKSYSVVARLKPEYENNYEFKETSDSVTLAREFQLNNNPLAGVLDAVKDYWLWILLGLLLLLFLILLIVLVKRRKKKEEVKVAVSAEEERKERLRKLEEEEEEERLRRRRKREREEEEEEEERRRRRKKEEENNPFGGGGLGLGVGGGLLAVGVPVGGVAAQSAVQQPVQAAQIQQPAQVQQVQPQPQVQTAAPVPPEAPKKPIVLVEKKEKPQAAAAAAAETAAGGRKKIVLKRVPKANGESFRLKERKPLPEMPSRIGKLPQYEKAEDIPRYNRPDRPKYERPNEYFDKPNYATSPYGAPAAIYNPAAYPASYGAAGNPYFNAMMQADFMNPYMSRVLQLQRDMQNQMQQQMQQNMQNQMSQQMMQMMQQQMMQNMQFMNTMSNILSQQSAQQNQKTVVVEPKTPSAGEGVAPEQRIVIMPTVAANPAQPTGAHNIPQGAVMTTTTTTTIDASKGKEKAKENFNGYDASYGFNGKFDKLDGKN